MKISALVRSSSQTNGAVTLASQRIGRDTMTPRSARASAARSAWARSRRSPAMTKVVSTMTRPKPIVCAVSGCRPSKLQPLGDRLAEARARKGARENGDQGDPALRRSTGTGRDRRRGRARIARPLLPALAIAFSRASRDETIASSLIDSTPFSAISARIRTTSSQGMGRRWSLIGGGQANLAPSRRFTSRPPVFDVEPRLLSLCCQLPASLGDLTACVAFAP